MIVRKSLFKPLPSSFRSVQLSKVAASSCGEDRLVIVTYTTLSIRFVFLLARLTTKESFVFEDSWHGDPATGHADDGGEEDSRCLLNVRMNLAHFLHLLLLSVCKRTSG